MLLDLARQYPQIDGFRIDQMGQMSIKTINQVVDDKPLLAIYVFNIIGFIADAIIMFLVYKPYV